MVDSRAWKSHGTGSGNALCHAGTCALGRLQKSCVTEILFYLLRLLPVPHLLCLCVSENEGVEGKGEPQGRQEQKLP